MVLGEKGEDQGCGACGEMVDGAESQGAEYGGEERWE